MTEQALSLYDSKDDLRTDAQTWAAQAASLQIVDRDSCLQAGTLLKSIKQLRAQVQAWFQPHVDAAMDVKRKAEAARKALTDERDKMERPLVEAETIVKRNLLMFEAKEEERRLDEEHRIQAEAQARAEQLTRDAAERMAAEGLRTGDVGLVEEAQSLFEQSTEAPVVHVESTVPQQRGITYRDNWKAHPEIDLRALCAAIGSEWRPMRTAPMDGTRVLLWWPRWREYPVTGRWFEGQWDCVYKAEGDETPPTHWLPLPAPPGEGIAVPVVFVTANYTAINQFGRSTQGTQPVAGVRWVNDRTVVARGTA